MTPPPKIVVTGVDGEHREPPLTPPPAYSVLPPPPAQPSMIRYDTMTSYCTSDSGTNQVITTLVTPANLEEPFLTKCPFCHTQVTTVTKGRVGTLTWLMCGLCVFVGCIAGCCLIPFCTRRLKNVEHSCPKCHCCIAIYKRL